MGWKRIAINPSCFFFASFYFWNNAKNNYTKILFPVCLNSYGKRNDTDKGGGTGWSDDKQNKLWLFLSVLFVFFCINSKLYLFSSFQPSHIILIRNPIWQPINDWFHRSSNHRTIILSKSKWHLWWRTYTYHHEKREYCNMDNINQGGEKEIQQKFTSMFLCAPQGNKANTKTKKKDR